MIVYENLLPLFIEEVRRHLDLMTDAAEQSGAYSRDGLRDALSRSAHTIKGNAAAMQLATIRFMAERLEQIIAVERDPERLRGLIIVTCETLRQIVDGLADHPMA